MVYNNIYNLYCYCTTLIRYKALKNDKLSAIEREKERGGEREGERGRRGGEKGR